MQIKELQIEEGGEMLPIPIRSLVPPRLFCPLIYREKGCNLQILGHIRAANEKKCPNGDDIIQAVFLYSHLDKNNDDGSMINTACGLKATTNAVNWTVTHSLFIKATIDGIYDRNQIRNVEIRFSVSVENWKSVHIIDNIKVSISKIYIKVNIYYHPLLIWVDLYYNAFISLKKIQLLIPRTVKSFTYFYIINIQYIYIYSKRY